MIIQPIYKKVQTFKLEDVTNIYKTTFCLRNSCKRASQLLLIIIFTKQQTTEHIHNTRGENFTVSTYSPCNFQSIIYTHAKDIKGIMQHSYSNY